MKVGMPLVKNVLALLVVTAAMSAIDGSIQVQVRFRCIYINNFK